MPRNPDTIDHRSFETSLATAGAIDVFASSVIALTTPNRIPRSTHHWAMNELSMSTAQV
jgi:hypothetical protein